MAGTALSPALSGEVGEQKCSNPPSLIPTGVPCSHGGGLNSSTPRPSLLAVGWDVAMLPFHLNKERRGGKNPAGGVPPPQENSS